MEDFSVNINVINMNILLPLAQFVAYQLIIINEYQLIIINEYQLIIINLIGRGGGGGGAGVTHTYFSYSPFPFQSKL